MKYRIFSSDLEYLQSKIDKQNDFLDNNHFTTSNGTVKSLRDVNMNANLSTRYYAQLVNKVNTLQQAMTNLDLIPVFLTITLDGWFHDLSYGDYSDFNDSFLLKLPENDKYGYLRTKAINREIFDVHDLYMVLRWQWDKFFKTRTVRKMRKEYQIGYLFATEPHESGVPHAHVLLYIPASYVLKLKEEFVKTFDAPMNITQDAKRLSPEQLKNGELNGFQWTINNPVGYILKYVTKSFMDIKNQKQLDELQAWYIKHRIVRFTTSHTLVPQWVYNKVYPLENNWLYLSDLKINSMCEWSAEDDYFKFEDTKLGKTLMYDRGLYQMFQDGELVHEFGERRERPVEIESFKYRDKFVIRKKKQRVKIEILTKDVQKIDFYKKSIPHMKNYELLQYYHSLDINKTPYVHYTLTKNECVKRCLIKGQIESLNMLDF